MTGIIQHLGIAYRIDYSHRLGWVVTVGTRVRYFSDEYDACVRWILAQG